MKNLFLLVFAFLVFGCAKDTSEPTTVSKVTLSTEEFATLSSLSGDDLARKAMVSQLGMCYVNHKNNERCLGYGTYSLYLSDLKVYYPSMKNDLSESEVCGRDIGTYVKQALEAGFCYNNISGDK